MIKKQFLAICMALPVSMCAMNEGAGNNATPSTPATHIKIENATIGRPEILNTSYSYTQRNRYETPDFTGQKLSNNPLINYVAIAAKAAVEGAAQGVFQGIRAGIGQIVTQYIVGALYKSPDAKNGETLLNAFQQIHDLETLRHEVNQFCKKVENEQQALELRYKIGAALKALIERQQKEKQSAITQLLPRLRVEIDSFVKDTQNTSNKDLMQLRDDILKMQVDLFTKQLSDIEKFSKPATVVPGIAAAGA